MLEHVQVRDDAVGAVEWTVSVDSTINRAHQHAAGARHAPPADIPAEVVATTHRQQQTAMRRVLPIDRNLP